MFAGSAFSTTPYSTAGAGVVFDVAFADSAAVTETVSAQVDFASLNSESAVGADIAAVLSAVFNVTAFAESATASELTSAQLEVSADISESSVATDTVTVGPSTFSAPVSETAVAADSVLALAVFFATMTDGAVTVDQMAARLLWELVNDSQNANWNIVNNVQSTTWTVNRTQS